MLWFLACPKRASRSPPTSDARCGIEFTHFAWDLRSAVRAGVEDNLYLPNGEMARSNGDLIAKARQMAEDVGRRAATVAEARELLGVPKRERSPA